VPSDKRARQRAAREQKQAVVEKDRKRRRNTRRGIGAVLVAAVIVLIVFLVSGSTNKGSTTTTTTATSTTVPSSSTTSSTTVPPTTFATPTTQALTSTPVVPTCPPASGSSTRVVWFTKAPPPCIPATSTWDATFSTSVGNIVVKMPAGASFAAVNNFVFLALYQYFNGTYFHRVIPGVVVQGGDPTGLGTGGPHGYPGYSFTGNTPPASCKTNPNQSACYQPFDLALANSTGPSSDASQFFFVLPGGQTVLNGEPNYTIFGKVVSGESVVEKIATYGSGTGIPKVKVYLLGVSVKQISS
jgi:cyclophilin family peptidyl-prolyl cis-trans isomerase